MPTLDLAQVAKQSGYPMAAFFFVQRGLDYTVRHIHGDPADKKPADPHDASRHVSGEQLCHGLRDFAIEEYGLLARTVLRRWNIRASEDFGRIVFAMVDAGLMHKTENDRLEDFTNVFDFAHAFGEPLTLTTKA